MNKLVFKLFDGKWNFAVFLILILILAGCSSTITGKAAAEIPKETGKSPEVYFCPKDDCGKALEAKILAANSSVHCAIYDLKLENLISAFSEKSKSIDVKIVMDSDNQKGQIKGNAVRLDNNNQLMHNKFCIIDNEFIVTGSFNPTHNDNFQNSNNMLVVYSKALADNYEDEFNELWNGKFGKGSNVKYPVVYINNIEVENYFCPEDKCASKVTELVNNAKESIYFMAFSFTNEEIGDALLRKNKIEIKGIFDASQSSSKYSQLKRLQEFGLDVKKDSKKYKLHHKVFIIDNSTVVTGSFNPTQGGDTKNDENILIIHDKKITNLFLREFDSLWK